MFERFTDRARRVLVLAQEEARVLNHNFLGTEHILLGLLSEGEGVGAKALQSLEISLEECRRLIVDTIGPSGEVSAGAPPPFTPRAKHVLEMSLREALQMGHNYIGTEHLLLGLIREGQGVAAHVLAKMGADAARVRQKVLELLSGYPSPSPEKVTPAGNRTPAAATLLHRAGVRAMTDAMGTHHLLLAMLDDPNSLAARVLQSLGVTLEAAADRIVTITTKGTTDEVMPPPADFFEVDLGDGITVRFAGSPEIRRLKDQWVADPEEFRAKFIAGIPERIAEQLGKLPEFNVDPSEPGPGAPTQPAPEPPSEPDEPETPE
jgi:ATP-dependent Clp protease ATP-binding subunit ClpA